MDKVCHKGKKISMYAKIVAHTLRVKPNAISNLYKKRKLLYN